MAKTGKRVITSTAMEIKIFLATWSFSLNRDPNDLLNCRSFQHSLLFIHIQIKSFLTFDQFFNFEITVDSHNFVLLNNSNYFLKK